GAGVLRGEGVIVLAAAADEDGGAEGAAEHVEWEARGGPRGAPSGLRGRGLAARRAERAGPLRERVEQVRPGVRGGDLGLQRGGGPERALGLREARAHHRLASLVSTGPGEIRL